MTHRQVLLWAPRRPTAAYRARGPALLALGLAWGALATGGGCVPARASTATAFATTARAVMTAPPARGASASASDLVVYRSAANGYSVAAPASWVRVPGVRWTARGPLADLTLMTPDHQAAFGVIVAPAGGRHDTDADLRAVALRLLYQQNGVAPNNPVQQQRIVVNGVPFQAVSAPTISGGTYTYSAETFAGVWVAQHGNRLYAVPALVYALQAAPPPTGPNAPTPTPVGGLGLGPAVARGMARRPAPAAVPTPGPTLRGARPLDQPSGPLAPLPTDRLRGNPCPDSSDGALIVRDKNCAFRLEAQQLRAMHLSFRFSAGAAPDRRPAPVVGMDGYQTVANAALGYRLAYPAQWKVASAPHVLLAAQSADGYALVTLAEQRTDAETLSLSDMQALAQSQIAQISSGPPPVYQTERIDGILYLHAVAAHAEIMPTNGQVGGVLLAQVSVSVVSYHHRVYSLRAAAVTYLASAAQNGAPPGAYPYFTPFTTLARRTQSTYDQLQQQSDLGAQTALSLRIGPHMGEG